MYCCRMASIPESVVHLYHIRAQAWGADNANVAVIGDGLVLVDELHQETARLGAIPACGVDQGQRLLLQPPYLV